jgi:ketosteroid isomerase-like protein
MPPRKGWEEEGEEKRRVVSLVKAVPKAIDTKDKEKILRIYDTYDPMFCSFEDTPDFLGRVDGPKFREFIDGLGKLESSSIARKDIRVDFVARNVAVATGMDDWESRINGKVTRGVSRFSIVFRKKDGEWKVIHEHFTKIA